MFRRQPLTSINILTSTLLTKKQAKCNVLCCHVVVHAHMPVGDQWQCLVPTCNSSLETKGPHSRWLPLDWTWCQHQDTHPTAVNYNCCSHGCTNGCRIAFHNVVRIQLASPASSFQRVNLRDCQSYITIGCF